MVTLLSLYLFATVVLLFAAGVARVFSKESLETILDARAALSGSTVAFLAAVVLFEPSRSIGAPDLWNQAGAAALGISPLTATLALRWRSRRSIPRALLTSVLALAGVIVWLTLNLRGPRGGWSPADVALVLPAAAVAVASAACLGWWTKRVPKDNVAAAGD